MLCVIFLFKLASLCKEIQPYLPLLCTGRTRQYQTSWHVDQSNPETSSQNSTQYQVTTRVWMVFIILRIEDAGKPNSPSDNGRGRVTKLKLIVRWRVWKQHVAQGGQWISWEKHSPAEILQAERFLFPWSISIENLFKSGISIPFQFWKLLLPVVVHLNGFYQFIQRLLFTSQS